MEKLCNVKPKRTVFGLLSRPFDSEKKNLKLTGKEIEIAMASGTVEEVLNDGTTRVLNAKNYKTVDEKTIVDIDTYLNGAETHSVDPEPDKLSEDPAPENVEDDEFKDAVG